MGEGMSISFRIFDWYDYNQEYPNQLCHIDVEIYRLEMSDGFTPGFWKHNIGVALGYNPGAYSAFSGGPLDGVHLTEAMLQGYATTVGVTFQQAYNVLSTGGGGAIAQARIDMANAFNAAAGYGPFVED